MRPGLVVAAAALLMSTLAGAATPTWAQAERRAPIVSATDAAGDVTIRDHDGPTEAQRRSVDLLGLKVVPHDDQVRFAFRIARVTGSAAFDQLLTATFVDAETGLPEVSGSLTLRVQHTRSGRAEASVEDDDGGLAVGCLGFPLVVVKAKGLVKIDVAPGCLPPGSVAIRLKSFTTTPQGERRTIYSRDFVRVAGSHDLGGTAGSERRG